ncbi:MAG: phasin family protein [Beijerinckiaceae bacterium]
MARSTKTAPAAKAAKPAGPATRPAAAKAVSTPKNNDVEKEIADAAGLAIREVSHVAEETMETAAEQFDNVGEMMRKAAEDSLSQSRAAFEKLRESADAATASFEESTAAGRRAASKFNSLMIESAKSSTDAVFELATALNSVSSLGDALTVWGELGRKQLEDMTRRNEKIAEAIQESFQEASRPFAPVSLSRFAA